MGKKLRIELESNDLGQALDGLETRAKAWEDTARYLATGESPNDSFIVDECSDVEEAENIAQHYRSILSEIHEQVKAQGGW